LVYSWSCYILLLLTMSESNENLILYGTAVSSYTQKVLLALNCLNLKFDIHVINLFAGEQLETWYLDLNPKGEVPCLKDGETILTDSADILQYLNDTYDTRRSDEKLIPNPVTPLGRNVAALNQDLSSVKMFLLTFGSFMHPELTKERSVSAEEVAKRTEFLNTAPNKVEQKLQSAVSPYKECYNYKLTKLATGKAMVSDADSIKNEIEIMNQKLEKVEEQLGQGSRKWLFGDYPSVADITLIVLLKRMQNIGFEHYFFADNSKPKCQAYFQRAMTEEFVKKTLV